MTHLLALLKNYRNQNNNEIDTQDMPGKTPGLNRHAKISGKRIITMSIAGVLSIAAGGMLGTAIFSENAADDLATDPVMSTIFKNRELFQESFDDEIPDKEILSTISAKSPEDITGNTSTTQAEIRDYSGARIGVDANLNNEEMVRELSKNTAVFTSQATDDPQDKFYGQIHIKKAEGNAQSAAATTANTDPDDESESENEEQDGVGSFDKLSGDNTLEDEGDELYAKAVKEAKETEENSNEEGHVQSFIKGVTNSNENETYSDALHKITDPGFDFLNNLKNWWYTITGKTNK